MAHSHAHGAELDVSASTKRVLVAVAAALGFLTLVGLVLLWPTEDPKAGREGFLADDQYSATVLGSEIAPCTGTDESQGIDCARVTLRLEQGPDRDEERVLEFPLGASDPQLGPGDEVVLNYSAAGEEGFEYQFADRQRRPVLIWLAALFAVCVVALGRLRGLAALAGLAASLVMILVFILPAILEGTSPVLVAIVGSSAIAFLALYLAHGPNTMTTVALIGTLGALGLTGLLSWLFTELAEFSGRATEEAVVLDLLSGEVDLSGLVLAGVVIGALGALDDMTVTQASSVGELRDANPSMARGALLRSSLRIGRDHVASTVNTLALAYVGAALPTMLLLVLSDQSLGTVANGEVVAIEIVRTLVGSIGLVASVPITTYLAVRVVAGPVVSETVSDSEPGPQPEPEPEPDPRAGPEPEDETDASRVERPDRRPEPQGRRRGRPPLDEDPDESFWTR